ncbi:hypothetical protein HQ520_01805 [bacterium]|nr:hypothetical protein [bacterium]
MPIPRGVLKPILFSWAIVSMAVPSVFAKGEKVIEDGYPKPVMFRNNSEGNLAESGDWIQFVVSDQFVDMRKYSEDAWKKVHPDRPLIHHVGGPFISANAYASKQIIQDRGLWQTPLGQTFIEESGGYEQVLDPDFVPMPDFLGYWVYEPGVTLSEAIPADEQIVVVKVSNPEQFEPVVAIPPGLKVPLEEHTGSPRARRVVLVCPRTEHGELDWLKAELGEVQATDKKAGTVTIRRFNTERGWPALPSGCRLAPSASRYFRDDKWGMEHTEEGHPYHYPAWPHMMANFTPQCPVDPRNGLNAAEWFARHFVERKKKFYPLSNGYALDVTAQTFQPGGRSLENADCDNDDVMDMGWIDGVNYWGLGMHDFVYYMRNGVPGKFKGLGDDLYLTWDSTSSFQQRFFHLLNGAEYEHAMCRAKLEYSGNLDRLLLWYERAQSPNLTFVSNKLPDEAYHTGDLSEVADPAYHLDTWRLEMASTAMGNGYCHSSCDRGSSGVARHPRMDEEIEKFGRPLPLDYDEYHQGVASIYGWLGRPAAPYARYRDHLGPALYSLKADSPLPEVKAIDEAWKAAAQRLPGGGVRFDVAQTGPCWSPYEHRFSLTGVLPFANARFEKGEEYTVRFRARASSPYGHVDERYRPIARDMVIRLRVNDLSAADWGKETAHKRDGFIQEFYLFEEERPVELTLISPASGEGVLEICLSECAGTVDFLELEVRKGCGDVLYRSFENGLVVLNGSTDTPLDFPVAGLFPDISFRRLKGTQDPEHNNGEAVWETLTIPPHDGFFLVRETD